MVNRQAREALSELLKKAHTKSCKGWLKQNINSGDDGELVKFSIDEFSTTGENGTLKHWEKLPKLGDTKKFLRQVKCRSNQIKSTKKWAPFISQTNTTIPIEVACLFLHILELGENLVPCQPTVAGPRFATLQTKGYKELQVGNITGVAYIVAPVGPDGLQEGAASVLPMTYVHSVALAEMQSAGDVVELFESSPTRVGARHVMGVFQILYGSLPEDEDNWKSLEEDGGAAKLFSLLLLNLGETYRDVGNLFWKLLLTAIAKDVFGSDACIDKLNDLRISNNKLPAFTLALFSCIIPLKLGFLSGESFVVTTHQALTNQRPAQPALSASTTLLQPRFVSPDNDEGPDPNVLPTKNLRCHSNELNAAARQGCTTGSIRDFFLETFLRCQTQNNALIDVNEEYAKDQRAKTRMAIDKIIAAAEHNPHVGTLVRSYKRRMLLQDADKTSDTITEEDIAEYTLPIEEIVNKFLEMSGDANVFAPARPSKGKKNKSKGPRNIFIMMTLLVDFCDPASAKAASEFIQTKFGIPFFPGGQVATTDLLPGNFANCWHKLQKLRKGFAKQFFDMYSNYHDVKLKDVKVQRHRFARRTSSEILRLAGTFGLDDDIVSNHAPTFASLITKTYDSALEALLMELLKAIAYQMPKPQRNSQDITEESQDSVEKDGDLAVVTYGESLTTRQTLGQQFMIDKIDLAKAFQYDGEDISPFALVEKILSGDAEPLLEMIQSTQEKQEAEQKEKRKAKKASTGTLKMPSDLHSIVSDSSSTKGRGSGLRQGAKWSKKGTSGRKGIFFDNEAEEAGASDDDDDDDDQQPLDALGKGNERSLGSFDDSEGEGGNTGSPDDDSDIVDIYDQPADEDDLAFAAQVTGERHMGQFLAKFDENEVAISEDMKPILLEFAKDMEVIERQRCSIRRRHRVIQTENREIKERNKELEKLRENLKAQSQGTRTLKEQNERLQKELQDLKTNVDGGSTLSEIETLKKENKKLKKKLSEKADNKSAQKTKELEGDIEKLTFQYEQLNKQKLEEIQKTKEMADYAGQYRQQLSATKDELADSKQRLTEGIGACRMMFQCCGGICAAKYREFLELKKKGKTIKEIQRVLELAVENTPQKGKSGEKKKRKREHMWS